MYSGSGDTWTRLGQCDRELEISAVGVLKAHLAGRSWQGTGEGLAWGGKCGDWHSGWSEPGRDSKTLAGAGEERDSRQVQEVGRSQNVKVC